MTATSDGEGRQVLERLVERQRRDNEGLRAALRHRAVIEQAKGILMARTGEDPDTVFRRLVAHSQRHNLRVVNVAARVVAGTITGRTPLAPRRLDADPLVETTDDEVALRLAAAAVTSAPDLRQLLEVVVEYAGQFGVVGGCLALAEPDGALRLVAWHGPSVQEASPWHRIPPGGQLPMTWAARERRPVWLRDRSERDRRFPAAEGFPGQLEGSAAIPLVAEGQLVGVLVLDWDEACDTDDSVRDRIEAVAAMCGDPVAELLRSGHDEQLSEIEFEPGHARWFQGVLDAVPTPVVVLQPLLEDGVLVDLSVLHANPAAAGEAPLDRRLTLIEAHPALAAEGFLAVASTALRSGGVLDGPEVRAGAVALGGTPEVATLTRVGSALVLSWS